MAAFEAIASTTLSSSASSITFSSIPGTYEHLQLRVYGKTNTTGVTSLNMGLRLNSDTGTNYAWHIIYGDGSGTVVDRQTSDTQYLFGNFPSQDATNHFGVLITDIVDYASTNKNKTMRSLVGWENNGSGQSWFSSGLWINTAAVNSLTVRLYGTGDLASGTVASLYGLRSS